MGSDVYGSVVAVADIICSSVMTVANAVVTEDDGKGGVGFILVFCLVVPAGVVVLCLPPNQDSLVGSGNVILPPVIRL